MSTITMSSHNDSRVLLLEQQVKTLSEDLVECQADKDFVWSLWKRLQVANPDLTQAVSLVVEREKRKAETKDRKVLEILQSKDFTIQELEQKVTGQQQEINNVVRRKMSVDEEKAEMKREQSGLLEKLACQGRELKDVREEIRRTEEEDQRAVRAMEEEKEGLASRCVALCVDLEEGQRQRDNARNRVMELEGQLSNAREEVLSLQSQSASMAAQLSAKGTEVATKEGLLNQLQREVLEVQALYRQSTEHAAEQSHLIRQLEGLNLDTQRVLRNQEEAHTTDATSHQQLYTGMSQCYQALVSSEAKLRQSHQELSDQLVQKEQLILQLQDHLQHQQQELTQHQQQLQQQAQEPMTVCPPPTRQTNFEELAEPAEAPILTPSLSCDPSLVPVPIPEPQHQAVDGQPTSTRNPLTQQGAPVQRSRSLSPAGSAETGLGRRGVIVGRERIQDLEDLLQLKTEENEALRSAHEKRHERLRLIQTNYRAVRDQLREAEEAHGLPKVTSRRAEPWQLRHEDSDSVWNELTHYKRLSRKLNADKANLEEELDVLGVQAAMDRATVKELRLCLQNEHQELLHKVAEGHQVSSSISKKPCVPAEQTEQSFRKMEVLEQRMTSLEEETERLREEKEDLLEANEELARDYRNLQVSLDRLRSQGTAREEAARAEALAQAERHCGEALALEARLDASQKETARLHGQMLRLRQELGILGAARDFYRNRTAAVAVLGTARGGAAPGARGERAATGTISSKVKFKTARLRGPALQHSHPAVGPNQAISWRGRRPSPTKDEWEDMSADSDGGDEYSDSLNSSLSGRRPQQCYSSKKPCRYVSVSSAQEDAGRTESGGVPIQDEEQRDPGERGTRGEQAKCGGSKNSNRGEERRRPRREAGSASSSSLRRRAEALRHHVDILQSARRDGQLVARELRQANQTLTAQLHSLTKKLHGSKQFAQKLTCDLAGLEQQKRVLEMELEQWRQVRLPQPTPPPPAVGTTESCSQDKAIPDPGPLQALEADVKQLQTRLKSSSAEATKQAAANKALRAQLLERDDKLRQLQDKVSHVERDATMKRQLVEDLKTRLKFFQETEKSYRGQVEELERKVKMLSEEAVNRKSLVDSLKRRLNVATTEKNQYEASCTKLKEDRDKKEQRVEALVARLGASERSMAELERTATRQMEGLAQQSSQALDTLQRQLGLAHSQLEQLHAFVKALASEMLRDVEEVKQQLMKRRRKLRKASSVAEKSGLSARSMIKAKSIAASILNMSESDLADMMDTDQEAEDTSEPSRDKLWLKRLDHLLQQKIPSAGQLMEAVCVKMKERKVLTEELATLATPVSENA